MKTLRYKFWSWAHRKAESLWHWIYYRKLKPLEDPKLAVPVNYTYVYEGSRAANAEEQGRGVDRVDFYRHGGPQ